MGWFGDIVKAIGGSAPKDMTFIPDIARAGTLATPVVADQVYIEMFVDSLRIDKDRSFATTFHGLVYCFASLAKLGDDDISFAAVSKPDKLAQLDKNSIGRVTTISKQMLGPVPWRGGNFNLQIGLFSVKSGNVLTPLLNFVTKVSDAAGLKFVNVAKPFLPLISEGMDLIAGQTEDTKLVVGVDTSMQLAQTVTCAIIANHKKEVDTASITLDPADGKLLAKNKQTQQVEPLEAAYCVFSIRATDRKADWGEIPELKEAYAALKKASDGGKDKEIEAALAIFKRKCLGSPDLIVKDAKQIVANAREQLGFPPEAPAAGGAAVILRGDGPVSKLPDELAGLNIYGD